VSDIEIYGPIEEIQIDDSESESQINDNQTFAVRYVTLMSYMRAVKANE
jgi:hypothetical protein